MSTEISAIIKEIQRIREHKAGLEDEEKVLWNRFFEIADDLAGPQQSYRFVDEDLQLAIAREMHQAAPKLKVNELQKDLTYEQWVACTRQERVLDILKLEAAVARGIINAGQVDSFTEYYAPVPHKKFGTATKKDLEE